MNINVMIVDDHVMIKEGIKHLLELNENIHVIAMASDGNECISILKDKIPDIVLLDINMPNCNGFDTLAKIKKINKKCKTIMLTVHNEIEYLMKAIDMEADGYILKKSAFHELLDAIYEVINNKIYIQPDMIPLLNSKMIKKNDDKLKIELLTNRELEVLVLLSEGMFNKNIADRLSISERTVKNHISNIFKKIEVADRTQAAVFAIRNNLIHI